MHYSLQFPMHPNQMACEALLKKKHNKPQKELSHGPKRLPCEKQTKKGGLK